MEIVSKTEGSKVTMEITGWLDTQTAPQLEKELSALDPGTTSLVFDFANLEYISSAGLRLVIAAYKKMAGKEGFRIVNVSDVCGGNLPLPRAQPVDVRQLSAVFDPCFFVREET